MKLDFLNEPRLVFANGTHICPRRGIAAYGVFDHTQETRRSEIHIGGIGTAEGIEALGQWLERCKEGIAAPSSARQQNLKLDFCGFQKSYGFGAEMQFGSDLGRSLKNSEIGRIVSISARTERIEAALELYYEEIKFLSQNRHVDVIVCVIPEVLYQEISSEDEPGEDSLEDKKRHQKSSTFGEL